MSSKTLKVITTVLGVLFLLFGLLMTLSGLLGVIGIAGSGLVENTISPLGQTLGDVPYAAATFGGLLILLLGITYIVALDF